MSRGAPATPTLGSMEAGSLTAALRARTSPKRLAFAGLVGAAICNFLAIGAVIPVLPRYVKGPVGAGDVAVGVVVGAFAMAAIVSRPLAGRLADARGRRNVLVAGMALSALAGALLFVPGGVPSLIAARLVLGLGEGAVFTAGAAWTVDLAPVERRGRLIGLFGLAVWGGMTLGPAIGEGLYAAGGYEPVWAFSILAPLAGVALAWRLEDRFTAPVATGSRPLIPRAAVRPGISLMLANFGYAAMAGFLVLHLDARGIGHGAAVFVAFAAGVVSARLAFGRLPDVLGPRVSAPIAGCMEAAGLVILALAPSLPLALVGAVVMGTGFSLLYPSLALAVVSRVPESRRGAALGGFTAFFDAGVGFGAPLAGVAVVLGGGYAAAFWLAAAAAAAGTALTISNRAMPGPTRGAESFGEPA